MTPTLADLSSVDFHRQKTFLKCKDVKKMINISNETTKGTKLLLFGRDVGSSKSTRVFPVVAFGTAQSWNPL